MKQVQVQVLICNRQIYNISREIDSSINLGEIKTLVLNIPKEVIDPEETAYNHVKEIQKYLDDIRHALKITHVSSSYGK